MGNTVLKITKPDKTTHVVPVANKAFYLSYNNRLPGDQKWKIEEVDEESVKDLQFIDETHVTPAEAVVKTKELQTQLNAKDAEIEQLKKLLAEKAGSNAPVVNEPSAPPASTPPAATGTAPKPKVEDVIALIQAATSVDQVKALIKDDERVKVNQAAERKIKELSA